MDEVKDDLISRKAAVELMMGYARNECVKKYENIGNNLGFHRNLHGECCYRKAAEILKNMPSGGTRGQAVQERSDQAGT